MNELHSQTILIVEDLKSDARLIERSLKMARIPNPIAFASDGGQAIDYLSGTGEYSDRTKYGMPILILLDLKLPRRDGFEVLQWIKQEDCLKRLPVVVLTSSNRLPDVNRAYDLGANSYLVKPVQADALIDIFRMLDAYWLAMNEPPDVTKKD